MRRCIALAAMLLLAACSNAPKQTAGLSQEMPLQPQEGNLAGNTLVYRSPDLDPTKYHGFYIPAAKVYDGADGQWADTDMAARERIAAQLTTDFRKALGAKGVRVVPAPAPGVMTLQLTLVGVEGTHGVVANAIKLTPIGMGLTLLKTATDRPATFTGSITVAGRMTDSKTDLLLAGFVSKQSPTAIDPRTIGGTVDTAMLASSKAADDFANAVVRARQQAR
jgi:hypothetical protein